MLAAWNGPRGGAPPFADVQVADFTAAIENAMGEKRREVAAITAEAAPPTFANTIAALEDAGRALDRVLTLYGVWSSTMSTKELQAIESTLEPKLAAFDDEIMQDARLFSRIEAVYLGPEKATLTGEQQRLVWLLHFWFVRAGAKLDDAGKQRMSAINQRLASLYTTFKQNLLADEEGPVTIIGEADAQPLPDSVRAGAAAAAEARGLAGQWAITNTRSAVEPLLTYSPNRALRETVFRTYAHRGDNGDAHDNKATITEIARLRAERAALLGFATHAHFSLEDTMAKMPERAMALLEAVWRPAVARVREEVAAMQKLAAAEGNHEPIAPWDYRYYAEKVRRATYDVDEELVKPYLQLEKLREGMFWVAEQLFGYRFTAIGDVPVYHPDVRVWEVNDVASGRLVGLWYFDPYARAGKQSGAWMSSYRKQEAFGRPITAIVSNNANFVKGRAGEAVLVSWDDARTLFHEFGHALHGLSSNVRYPSLGGTAVARDYVEFPSQLLESWLPTRDLLGRFAVHHQTGAPLPLELIEKIEKAATFNQGFHTVEYLAAAIVDMKLHLAGNVAIDPAAFERETLAAIGMPKEIVMRHRMPQFSHAFSGDAYAAGYYCYLWADTLSTDAFDAFLEASGPFDREVARRLREHVLSVGNTIDPTEGYRAFRGHDAGVAALLRKRGFPAQAAPP